MNHVRKAASGALLAPAYIGAAGLMLFIIFVAVEGCVLTIVLVPVALIAAIGLMEWRAVGSALEWWLSVTLELASLALICTIVYICFGWLAGRIYPPWAPPFMNQGRT